MASFDSDWRRPDLIGPYLAAARGDEPADLLLTGGRVIDVFTGRIIPADVAVYGGRVVGLGPGYRAGETVDVAGAYIAPSFIDGHMHLESTMLTPSAYAQAAVPRGTGAVAADPHEIGNVLGLAGIRWLMAAGADQPMDFYFNAPSCVPASPLGTSGATLTAEDLLSLTDNDRLLGLGEVMNFPGVAAGDPDMTAKLWAFRDRPIDGHAPLMTGPDLNAYALAGPASDHECLNTDEALEKMSRGIRIMIRQGSTTKNLADLLPLVDPSNSRRAMLVTDDLHADDLLARGHLNVLLKMAVDLGLDPVTAVRMVTLNPAEHFGLRNKGAIAPGYRADLVVLDDLDTFTARLVYHRGELVARQGRPLFKFRPPEGDLPPSMNVAPYDQTRLAIPARGGRVRVIGLVPDQVYTEHRLLPAPVVDGKIDPLAGEDLAKLAVVERHHATGNIGLGLVQGLGLQAGALASSVGHDCHNLIGAGINDADLYAALRRVEELGGGQVAVRDGRVLAEVALPIAGLISPAPAWETADKLTGLYQAARGLGPEFDPFMALSFLALEVIPELKLTDQGLVDGLKFQLVDLFAD